VSGALVGSFIDVSEEGRKAGPETRRARDGKEKQKAKRDRIFQGGRQARRGEYR
jgi:hypothetical protein